MSCTVCNHPQCRDIDLALLSGGYTLKSLHQRYGPSGSALWRHKNHLEAKMFQARERLQRSQAQVSLLKLNNFLDHVQRGIETAAADGDIDRVFKGSHIGSRLIHQINRLEVSLELDTVYRLISSPDFVSQDSLLPTGPQIITDLHQALLDTATAPCPEPPPELFAEDDDEGEEDDDAEASPGETDDESDDDGAKEEDISPASFLETSNPELETRRAQLEALRLLQRHYPDLDLSAAVSLAEKDPENQRDKSAKLPRQTPPSTEKIIEIQEDIPNGKNLPKNPGVGRESDPPPADMQVPLPPNSPGTQNSELRTKNCFLPNRRREEDFGGSSLFREIRKYF